MGDRCSMNVRVRPSDQKGFEEIFGPAEDFGGGVLFYDEMNAGGYEECLKAAEAGLVFEGAHGAGDEYGSCAFAAIGGEHFEVPCDPSNGAPLVEYSPDPKVMGQNIAAVEDFLAARRKVRAAIEEDKARPADAPTAAELFDALENCAAVRLDDSVFFASVYGDRGSRTAEIGHETFEEGETEVVHVGDTKIVTRRTGEDELFEISLLVYQPFNA